jgi:hypothetical protein
MLREQYIYYAVLYLFGGCITTIILAWPISEIAIGVYYKDQLICPNYNPEISVDNWLIVKGSITISTIGILTFSFLTFKNTFCYSFVKFILGLSNLFTLSWIIFGSYIFWGNCKDLTPNSINIYMWFSLILSYVFIFNSASAQNAVHIKKSKTPLLDIA